MMDKLFSVTSSDSFLVKGRGMIFVIKSPIKTDVCDYDNLSNILGKNIIIDDREYEITSIERRCYKFRNVEIDDELAIIVKDG